MIRSYENIRYFFLIVFLLIIFVFSRSFIGSNPAIAGSSLVVKIHATVLFLWASLFVIQPFLIHFGKRNMHILLGKASYFLVPVIVITTILIAIQLFKRSGANLSYDKRINLLCSQIAGISLFAIFYLKAVLNSGKPVLHLKYILGTSFVLLGPVIFRSNLWWFHLTWFGDIEYTSKILVCLFVDCMLLALIGYDRLKKTTSSPYVFCLALIAGEQFLDLFSVYALVWKAYS